MPGHRPGFSGQPVSWVSSPPVSPTPAASTSRSTSLARLTPPEESAEPTHRDPSLSRLRPAAARTLPPCSRGRVLSHHAETGLGQSLVGAPRRHHQEAQTSPFLSRDPSLQPHFHALLLKRTLHFPLYKKAAPPPPEQSTCFLEGNVQGHAPHYLGPVEEFFMLLTELRRGVGMG